MLFLSAFTNYSQQNENDKNYFQISPRVGYDFPNYKNNTPYIDYKGGLDLGVSLDYYFNWFGIGVDFDYIKNSPESIYPTTNLLNTSGVPFTFFNLSEDNITRVFYGIGPNFQYRSDSRKFKTELNTRFGLGSIKGGRTLLEGSTTTSSGPFQMLNFHAGYDDSSVFTFKGQLRFTYFFSDNFGINAGAYYMRHFGVQELMESGIAASFHSFTANAAGRLLLNNTGVEVREEACKCDISSIGVFAGITFKFNKKEKADVCNVCGKDHFPRCCATCGCGVTVTARDRFTNETLPNTDVVLVDLKGNIVQSGTTNGYGVVVFSDVAENDYVVKGKLYNVNLEETSISKSEFKTCKKEGNSIQKVIKYGDLNFILKGNVLECNTDKGIQDVDIVLKNTLVSGQKNTLSDAKGNFIFHLKQASTFLLKGNKDGYFSNEVSITTNDYDRNKSLFIEFEMCINPCGKAIKLDNINFNLDKWDILPTARPDLDYVVKLMKENPTIRVEMSSHTDSRGSNQYNQELSQKRAQSTIDYLMTKGISRDRLIARGAGETELLNRCADGVNCAESEHTINRRTEFKVVCID